MSTKKNIPPFGIKRAINYPYEAPDEDYLYLDGKVHGIERLGALQNKPEEWINIVAYGSNRSPEQLRRKFPHNVPVISKKISLKDHDVVRSAHFTSYASIPATVISSPGSTAHLFLQRYPAVALERLHGSEALGRNYEFLKIDKKLMDIKVQGEVFIYKSLHGVLKLNGKACAFTEIKVDQRTIPQFSQPELMKKVHILLHPEIHFNQWIETMSQDTKKRQKATDALKFI